MSLVDKLGPTAEPISLTAAKNQIKLESGVTEDDALLKGLIMSVRRTAEFHTARRIVQQTLVQRMDCFPGLSAPIRLMASPLLEVESIAYVDSNGTTQTLSAANYRVDKYADEPRITPLYGTTWPSTQDVTNAVTVTFKAGYLVPVTADAAADTLAATDHPFADGDVVQLFNTDDDAPEGLSTLTNYYVVNAAANTIQLAESAGGSAIDITGVGTGNTFIGTEFPSGMAEAMKLLLTHLYMNRSALVIGNIVRELPMGVSALLSPYRVDRFV